MALSATEKKEVISKHRLSDSDTGSVEVQISLLTKDILKLTEHFKTNKQDVHSRRGLMGKVNKRRKLLKYLKDNDIEHYRKLVGVLGLRNI